MAFLGDLLFFSARGPDLDDVLRGNAESMGVHVEQVPESDFGQKSDEELAKELSSRLAVTPIEVDFDNGMPSVEQVSVEVSDWFSYGLRQGETTHVPGLEVSKRFPFVGDPKLWYLKTNPFDLSPPRGRIVGQHISVGISVPTQQAQEAKKYIDDTVNNIQKCLARQQSQIQAHNARLSSLALPLIQQRRSRLNQAAELLKSLTN